MDLFAYNDDLGGVCDAITDITDGLLDGTFLYSEHLMSTIERCIATFPVAVSHEPSRQALSSAEDRIRAVRDRVAQKELASLSNTFSTDTIVVIDEGGDIVCDICAFDIIEDNILHERDILTYRLNFAVFPDAAAH